MRRQHVIYVSGLGDGYDTLRRLCLLLWRRPGRIVTHMPMHWRDEGETYEAKLIRLGAAIERHPDRETVLVGESAGGAVAVGISRRYPAVLKRVITVCGMNRGAENVSPRLYRMNPAFHDAMKLSDRVVASLDPSEGKVYTAVYSSLDFTVRLKDTRIAGAHLIDLKVPGHMPAIFSVLLWRYRQFL